MDIDSFIDKYENITKLNETLLQKTHDIHSPELMEFLDRTTTFKNEYEIIKHLLNKDFINEIELFFDGVELAINNKKISTHFFEELSKNNRNILHIISKEELRNKLKNVKLFHEDIDKNELFIKV